MEYQYNETDFKEKVLRIPDLLHYVIKNLKYVIIVALVFAVIGACVPILLDSPAYTASTRIYIIPFLEIESTEAQFSTIMVNDCKSIITGEDVIENVIKKLDLKTTVSDLISTIEVTSYSNSRVIQISTTQCAPDLAVKIANAVREESVGSIESIVTVEEVHLVHAADFATEVKGDSPVVFAALAAIASAALLICVFAVIYILDESIKTELDVRDCLGVPTLGAIPAHREKDAHLTREQINFMRTNFIAAGVTFAALTGFGYSAGTTETAYSLAASLARSGKKTLLIEADMRTGSLASFIGQKPEAGLSDLLSGKAALDKVTYVTDVEHLSVIFAGTETSTPSELIASDAYEALINSAKATYDFVIVDTPPVGQLTDAASALRALDGAVLVINAKHNSYKLEARAKKAVENAGSSVIGAVINNADFTDRGGYYGRAHAERYASSRK